MIHLRRMKPFLGTFVEIRVQAEDKIQIQSAVNKAFSAVEQVHCLMSFHDLESDISKLNQLASEKPVQVHSWTYEVLKKSIELSHLTEGWFDCTVAPKLVEWEYLPQTVKGVKKMRGSYRDIEFLEQNKVFFRKPLMVDLGGIAKGFAVDKAVDTLQENGVKAGSVNAGGDLRIFGEDEQPLYVRDPRRPTKLIFMRHAKEISVATSADYYSRKSFKGRKVSPIANPIKKKPCLRRWSVSVLASSCMIADALTKVVMLKGDDANSLLKEYDADAFILKN